MSPGVSEPPDGNPLGTNATPYGFRSPFAGTVETVRNRVRLLRIEAGAGSDWAAGLISAWWVTGGLCELATLSSARDSRASHTGRIVLRCDRRFSMMPFSSSKGPSLKIWTVEWLKWVVQTFNINFVDENTISGISTLAR